MNFTASKNFTLDRFFLNTAQKSFLFVLQAKYDLINRGKIRLQIQNRDQINHKIYKKSSNNSKYSDETMSQSDEKIPVQQKLAESIQPNESNLAEAIDNQNPQKQHNSSMEVEHKQLDQQQVSEEQQNKQVQQGDQEQQGQINQDQQIQAEAQEAGQQDKPQPADKDGYINRLQNHLNKVRNEHQTLQKSFAQLTEDNKKTKQILKKLRFQHLSSKQQITTLTQQKSELQKQKSTVQKQNQQLQEQIKTYKEAGDINFFKNKITQLQNYLQIQKQELSMKNSMVDEKDQIQQGLARGQKSKVQILKLIEKFQKENRDLVSKFQEVNNANSELKSIIVHNQTESSQFKLKISQLQNTVEAQKQTIAELEVRLKQVEDEFNRKIKQNQENMAHYINQKDQTSQFQVKPQVKKIVKSPQQTYGIKILTPIQERDLILREFIELEIKYQSSVEQLSALRQRHYNTLKQLKNISSTHINKKEYSELYKKYSKLRKCLQNSLINEQNLRSQLLMLNSANATFQSQVGSTQQQTNAASQSRYRSIILQQPQNDFNKIQKIVQKSSQSYKQLFTLRQQLQMKQKVIKSEKLIKEKDQIIEKLQKQAQKYKGLIDLYDQELTYKNNEIQMLRKNNKQAVQKIFALEVNYFSKEDQQTIMAQVQETRLLNNILEVKNIEAMKENNVLKNQKALVTELYNNLKTMYEEILSRQPQLMIQEENKQSSQVQKDRIQVQKQAGPCKQCLEREEKQKSIKYSESESQTDGLAEIYYKEIKELLTVMRKFPKKADSVINSLQTEKETINHVKKRYEQVMQTYGAKYRQLQEEKKANDQWRVKQRQEIREQFQQIRQMILNERLVSALRKAKSLIQSYEENAPEAEGDQNAEGGQQEDPNENNQASKEEPIQEEKGSQ